MKTTFNITVLLLLALCFGYFQPVSAAEKTKIYEESWPATGVETLEISNRFGDVKFTDEGGKDVTITVVVKVEASSEKKVAEMLDKINVAFSKSGSTVKASTSLENNYNFSGKFSIDYLVNVPPAKNLVVSNKYGNVIVNKLLANGDFDIQYGNITANELIAPVNGKMILKIAYGKGNMIEKAGNINLVVSYSTVRFGSVADVKLESKYSGVELEKGSIISIDSKYDKFSFGRVKSISAVIKYTQLRVDYLASLLKIESGYGGIKIAEIASGFESISITNSYGQISLGLGNLNYSIDAQCNHCGITYPQERFKGNRIKENNSFELAGKIGPGNEGSVMVRSRYGEIKLLE